MRLLGAVELGEQLTRLDVHQGAPADEVDRLRAATGGCDLRSPACIVGTGGNRDRVLPALRERRHAGGLPGSWASKSAGCRTRSVDAVMTRLASASATRGTRTRL